jgi:glyceraldehyde-3-phosphate dehydrogenase (NAD(P))
VVALNAVKELMADRGRPHDNLYEVALWADAIRALTRTLEDGNESIARTNAALGIESALI